MIIDAIFRFSGIGFLTLITLLSWRDFKGWHGTPYLILACISLIALFLGYAPEHYRLTGIGYQVVRLLDVPHLIFVWWFTLSLFQPDFTLKRSHLLIAFAYCSPIFCLRLEPVSAVSPYLIYWVSLTSLILMLHLCFNTMWHFRDDLSDSRRKFRVYFFVLLGFVTLFSAISEILLMNASYEMQYLSKVLSIWPAIFLGTLWMLGFRSSSVLFGQSGKKPNSEIPQSDKALWKRLMTEIEDNAAYKEPKLTIVELAKRLGVTQHRLRYFINHNLGYSNFSALLNSYRLNEVKRYLEDPNHSQTSILSLALDAGFSSLPSFNRVFKTAEGLTPTQYRQHYQKVH